MRIVSVFTHNTITMQEHRNSLQAGYRLHWYVIKRILGQGGFGITYLAEDTNLNQQVAIKEYLPIELAVREQDASIYPVSGKHGEQFSWGLDRFMSEAQTLAQFKHPNIVRVLTVFPENNTAYMVMEYEKGQAMHELLQEKKILTESELSKIYLPVLDGLEQVHNAGFIHRDIKPPNIFIRADGSPVLLDFGSARQSLGEKTHTLTSMVSPGFAPFEQYVSKSDKQGPWTDIYGLAATLYRSVTGRSPAEAMDRSEALLHTHRDSFVGAAEISPEGYSRAFLAAIDHALAFRSEDRPQSIYQWRAELTQTSAGSQYSEAETIQALPATDLSAENVGSPTTAKITMMVDEPAGESSENTAKDKPLRWYRKPLQVIAVVFGILLLLIILDESGKQGKEDKSTVVGETVSGQRDAARDEIDKFPDSPLSETKGSAPLAGASDSPVNIAQLLQGAAEDISALRLTSPAGNNALDKYRQVLTREPDNKAALAGMDNIAGKYVEMAQKALQDGNAQHAALYLDKASRLNSRHAEIPALKKAIAEHQHSTASADRRENDSLPAKAGNVISSSDRRKLARLQRQLARDPDNRKAKQALLRLGSKYEALVEKAIKNRQYDLAESYVKAAIKFSPDSKKLHETLQEISSRRAADH